MGKIKKFLFNNRKKEEPEEPTVILESWSPLCDIQAFVEKSSTAYYFYLWVNPSSDNPVMKPCWICNRIKAKDDIDYDAMNNGTAPMMPSSFVKHDINGINLAEDKLSVVWFEEGDGAALLENEKIICVIPSWADRNFYGYAKYADGTAPFAWGLYDAYDVMSKRVERSQKYWNYMDTDYFTALQENHLTSLQSFFGEYEKYFAIDNNQFPPKALITGSKDNINYAFTLGLSALCQPEIERYFEEDDYLDFRRIELSFACTDNFKNSSEHMKLLSYMSAQTTLPWRALTWLGNGHTIPCNAIDGFSAVLLLNSNVYNDIDNPVYKNFLGERINNLWLVPLTSAEYEFAQSNSSEELLDKYSGNFNDLVVFDGHAKFL
ncbi:suppressor of fused domain protein [Inconstantimicrobium porci]|uniref:suppressor of fused domain protein n=2 Tax=Inconstantimicrobium porci TaxID=2652291 RepID=UPI002409D1F6|nr:suppressor of fused domain protein [Inconstantimicrobium porci]MDD6771755.1 suppressor of fused domain protein [Inconstantimicrobium porci]